jgi:rhamnulokinase
MTTMVAVDLGAQSGRVALGRFDGERLSVSELHRFPNVPVLTHGTLHWDVLALYAGVLEGLRAAARETGGQVDSVGIDTWGVDFALLDRDRRLIGNPVHHRDARHARGVEAVLGRIPARELYQRTGIQLMPINTVFQLGALAARSDEQLRRAETLLLLPDLLHFWLSGELGCEFTNATTTACLDPRTRTWDTDLLERVGIPGGLFAPVIPPGTALGPLRGDVADDTRLRGTRVIAPATHDTASAVASVPFARPDAAYISAGTWSLVGLERPEPLVDERTFAANLTNEGGVAGTFRLLKNVTGLWLLHECRRTWALGGHEWSFAELVSLAEAAPPLRALVDPDDPSFAAPGDMPNRIRAFCEHTGQPAPDTPGEVVRCALESIALGHARAVALLRDVSGEAPPELHIVGGGAHNRLLCQWTADATGLPVLAGPAEATMIGNLAVQAIALDEISSLEQARGVVRASIPLTLYEPGAGSAWNDGSARFEALAAATRPAPEEALTP